MAQIIKKQNKKAANDFDQGNKQVFRSMMGELANVEQIARHARHHDAGIVPVIVRKRQSLVLFEQIPAHVAFHARAHDMALGDT